MEFISQEEAIGRFDMKRLPEKASETVRIVKVGDLCRQATEHDSVSA